VFILYIFVNKSNNIIKTIKIPYINVHMFNEYITKT